MTRSRRLLDTQTSNVRRAVARECHVDRRCDGEPSPSRPLALLAVKGRQGLSRDTFIGLFWPESDSEHGRNSLSQVISVLRRELTADDVLLGTTELRVNPDVLACDVVEFENRIAADDLEAATKLYTGPFLDGVFLRNTPEFEHWMDQERARFHHMQGDALERLATRAGAKGDHASCGPPVAPAHESGA